MEQNFGFQFWLHLVLIQSLSRGFALHKRLRKLPWLRTNQVLIPAFKDYKTRLSLLLFTHVIEPTQLSNSH